MDRTEAKQFSRKLIESMHGYRDALSGVLQGKLILKLTANLTESY